MIVRSATIRKTRWKNGAKALTSSRRSASAPDSPAPGTGHSVSPIARDHERPMRSTFTTRDASRPASATPHNVRGFFTEKPSTTNSSAKTARMMTGRRTRAWITSRHPQDAATPGVDRVQEEERKDAEDREQDAQHGQRADLVPVGVLRLLPPRVQGPEHRSLHRVDVVGGGEHDDQDRDGEGQAPGGVHAEEHRELCREPDESGQPEGREEGDH